MVELDGFFLIHKEMGITSSKLVQNAKERFRLEKAGHTGTLDSFAEGLMILPVGKACCFSSLFLKMNKTYEATLELGLATDSGDPEGMILEKWPRESVQQVWEKEWSFGKKLEEAIRSVAHWKTQEAPLISALKKNGKRMSDLYRSGLKTETRIRSIQVESVKIQSLELTEIRFQISVSSGTYIRKIAIDLGKELGVPMSLRRLVRTAIGPVGLEGAKPLSETQKTDLRSVFDLLPFPVYTLETKFIPWVETGRKPPIPPDFLKELERKGESHFFLVTETRKILSWASPEKNYKDWKFNRVFV